jgi:hypothetical protein
MPALFPGSNGFDPAAAPGPYGAPDLGGGLPNGADSAPSQRFAAAAFANDVLNPPEPGADPTANA